MENYLIVEVKPEVSLNYVSDPRNRKLSGLNGHQVMTIKLGDTGIDQRMNIADGHLAILIGEGVDPEAVAKKLNGEMLEPVRVCSGERTFPGSMMAKFDGLTL